MTWESPPIADASLTYYPDALVALWAVIAANRAHDERLRRRRRRRCRTAHGLALVLPLAAAAIVGLVLSGIAAGIAALFLLVTGWLR